MKLRKDAAVVNRRLTGIVTAILAIGTVTACAGGRQTLPPEAGISAARSSSARTALSQQPGLVLYNTLGSRYNVLHSLVGPNLEFCDGQAGCTVFPYVKANPAYVQGHTGTDHAITIAPGNYEDGEREINVILTDPAAVLDSDEGTISVWFKANALPVGHQYGVYRLFGGAFDLGTEFVQLWMDGSKRLYFTIGVTDPSTEVTVNSVKTGQPGVLMTRFVGKWIHIQAVWNRNGIGTSGQTLQLRIDTIVRAAATANGWTTDVGSAADIAGGNDAGIAGKFDEGQLQIYNTNP